VGVVRKDHELLLPSPMPSAGDSLEVTLQLLSCISELPATDSILTQAPTWQPTAHPYKKHESNVLLRGMEIVSLFIYSDSLNVLRKYNNAFLTAKVTQQ
jgi:hypothetical protein